MLVQMLPAGGGGGCDWYDVPASTNVSRRWNNKPFVRKGSARNDATSGRQSNRGFRSLLAN